MYRVTTPNAIARCPRRRGKWGNRHPVASRLSYRRTRRSACAFIRRRFSRNVRRCRSSVRSLAWISPKISVGRMPKVYTPGFERETRRRSNPGPVKFVGLVEDDSQRALARCPTGARCASAERVIGVEAEVPFDLRRDWEASGVLDRPMRDRQDQHAQPAVGDASEGGNDDAGPVFAPLRFTRFRFSAPQERLPDDHPGKRCLGSATSGQSEMFSMLYRYSGGISEWSISSIHPTCHQAASRGGRAPSAAHTRRPRS